MSLLEVSLIFIEKACEILTALQDLEVVEDSNISLSLVLSKARPVVWKKDDKTFSDNENFEVSVVNDGLEHVLQLKGLNVGDHGGQYTAHIDDNEYGSLTSSCRVVVKGSFFLYYMISLSSF